MKIKLALLLFLNISLAQASTLPPQDLSGDQAQAALSEYEARIGDNANDTEALKAAGIILHQMNRAQPDPQLVQKAESYLKQAKKLQEDDLETIAWLGSVTTMKAQFESDPGKQSFFVKLGSRMMDKAVKKAPDNAVVRLTRAYNSLELPPFLMRTKFAVEDFKYYLKLCENQECPQYYVDDANAKLVAAEKIIADNF